MTIHHNTDLARQHDTHQVTAMPSTGATAEHAQPRLLSRRSENDQAELDLMDAAVERMKKHTPRDPYLMTIERDKKLQY